jgi:uncharacterized protein YcfJ
MEKSMKTFLTSALTLSALVAASHAAAQITLYEGEGFRGRAYTSAKAVTNMNRSGLNDRTSSVVVEDGRWEVCEHANFGGKCVVLRRGSYDSLRQWDMANTISSARPADKRRHYRNEVQAPMETPNYAWRRRANERVYDAPVTSSRAIMGAATQHCWVERQQVSDSARGDVNVGGAIAGALIGGVLGHQVGGGRGKDLATVGGAVAGGVIGANVGRNVSTTAERDVQRCETTPSGAPAYWDVTYKFRGQDHNIQMTAAPGHTIAVNGNGEPRQ